MSLYKLEQTSNNIIKELDIIKGKNISQPLLKLGYNYEINELRNKYIKIKDKEYQIKLKNDMNELTNRYLNKELNITNIFNKYWELLIVFKILDENKKNILLINDYNTDIYECLINFKEKIYNKKNKQDDISIYNINNDDYNNFNKYKKIEYIDKKNKIKDKNEYELIIGNTDIKLEDINYKEQYLYDLKIFELITILKNQKKGGISIIKYYDTYTITSIRLLNILQEYYENIYIYKTKIEDKNSDKFIICFNYKGINKIDIKKIEQIYKDIINNNKLYLLDMINNDIENINLENKMRDINIDIIYNLIKNIKKYNMDIENNNITDIIYNREELNKEWINNFYPINEEELNILRNKK